MAWFSINDLLAAGIAPPPPWRRVPDSISGFGGFGGLGRGIPVMPADPAEISAASQAVESLYSQIKSFAQQISDLVSAIQGMAGQAPNDPTVAGAANDSVLVAQNAGQKLAQADLIHAFDASWVTQAVSQQVHGGWGFGRDVILGGSLGDTSKNFSGRPLDPWNRLQILKAAQQELASIQASMARDLGTARAARDNAQKALDAYKRAVVVQQQQDVQVSQQQQFASQLTLQAQQVESEKAAAAQRLAQQQAEFEARMLSMRQALEQRKLEAEQRIADAQAQAAEQQLAQAAAAEQARAAQALQLEQARAQQELQFSAQQQQLQLQQQYAQTAQAYYPAAAPYGPAVGPMTGAMPQAMQPSPWPQWNQAAAAAVAAGINPASVVSYGSPSFSPQSVAMQPGALPQVNMAPNWSAGGGVYGFMGATVSPAIKPIPTGGQSLLTALPGLIAAGGGAASSVLLARKGIVPGAGDQAVVQSSGGGGLGASLGSLALLGGLGFVGWKLLSKSGGRRRR